MAARLSDQACALETKPEGIDEWYLFKGTSLYPDQGIIAKDDDENVYAAFRGTLPPFEGKPVEEFFDWVSNLIPGTQHVCGPCGCCKGRIAWVYSAHFTAHMYDTNNSFYRFGERLRKLAYTCGSDGKQLCHVILTGHSQGGALATIAAVVFADLDPTVITFGGPQGLLAPCRFINEERVFRFINIMVVIETEKKGTIHRYNLRHDWGAFLPGADHFGHAILLSDQLNAVTTYQEISLADTWIKKDNYDFELCAHALKENACTGPDVEGHGYIERVDRLRESYKDGTLTSTMGWPEGAYCSLDGECHDNLICEVVNQNTLPYSTKKQCVAPSNGGGSGGGGGWLLLRE